MGLEEDIAYARAKGLRFEVARKPKQFARWETVVENLADLGEAMARAREIVDYESGVFVTYEQGGFIYWTSRTPDLFNGTVLRIRFGETK